MCNDGHTHVCPYKYSAAVPLRLCVDTDCYNCVCTQIRIFEDHRFAVPQRFRSLRSPFQFRTVSQFLPLFRRAAWMVHLDKRLVANQVCTARAVLPQFPQRVHEPLGEQVLPLLLKVCSALRSLLHRGMLPNKQCRSCISNMQKYYNISSNAHNPFLISDWSVN